MSERETAEQEAAERQADHVEANQASSDDMEPVMVLLSFKSESIAELMNVLSEYVVLSRGHQGCRNIDFVASVTNPGRVAIIQKWESVTAQRRHFDSDEMVTMAQRTVPLLTADPDIDLFEGISMHDLA